MIGNRFSVVSTDKYVFVFVIKKAHLSYLVKFTFCERV